MPRKGEKIHAKLLDIHVEMPDALGGVKDKQSRMGQPGSDRCNSIEVAIDVIDLRQGDQACSGCHLREQIREIDSPAFIHTIRGNVEGNTKPLEYSLQIQPGQRARLMIISAEQHFISILQIRQAPAETDPIEAISGP